MKLDEILKSAGKYKPRKRIGRGTGSGHGKMAGRGTKGYYSRSGNSRRIGYEGGQTPIYFRVPKRGFSNVNFAKQYSVINVAALARFDDGARVDLASMFAAGLIADTNVQVKILGNGELSKKLTVVAHKFSASAAKKIGDAGGTVEQA